MADLTIRENCLQQFKASLCKLKTGNGYASNVPDDHIRRSEVYPPDPAGFSDGHFLFIYEGIEKPVDREYGSPGGVRIKNELAVSVTEWVAWLKTPAVTDDAGVVVTPEVELPAVLNTFDGEVIKAGMKDQALGGYAEQIELGNEGSDDDFLEGEFYIGIRERVFIITYWCLENDPFDKGL